MSEFQFNLSNLRVRRIALRFSQKLLSQLTGIGLTRLSHLESDLESPSFNEIKRVFEALEMIAAEIQKVDGSPRARLKHLKEFVKQNKQTFQKAMTEDDE